MADRCGKCRAVLRSHYEAMEHRCPATRPTLIYS